MKRRPFVELRLFVALQVDVIAALHAKRWIHVAVGTLHFLYGLCSSSSSLDPTQVLTPHFFVFVEKCLLEFVRLVNVAIRHFDFFLVDGVLGETRVDRVQIFDAPE